VLSAKKVQVKMESLCSSELKTIKFSEISMVINELLDDIKVFPFPCTGSPLTVRGNSNG